MEYSLERSSLWARADSDVMQHDLWEEVFTVGSVSTRINRMQEPLDGGVEDDTLLKAATKKGD
jgi:hypothetical protein